MCKENKKVRHVLFDPIAVGWDRGLEGAIEDAKHFKVPLAVKDEMVRSRIHLIYQHVGVEIIVIG